MSYYVPTTDIHCTVCQFRHCSICAALNGYSKVEFSVPKRWQQYVGQLIYMCSRRHKQMLEKKKNRENRRWGSRCWEQYYVQKLLLQTHGNFAWRDAYLWLAARVYALSPNFLSAKIHQIFSIISVRLQWSLRKRILFNTVALRKRIKQKCSNNSKCLSQGSQA